MKHKGLSREVLKSYTTEMARENGLPTIDFSETQWRVMSEKMNHFISLYRRDAMKLLQFLYIWFNYRDMEYEQIPWTAISSDEKMPKEQFNQMRNTWTSLERAVIEFTRLNQKMQEQQKGKEPEQER